MKNQRMIFLLIFFVLIMPDIINAQTGETAEKAYQQTTEELQKTEDLLDMEFEALMDIAVTSVSKKEENIQHVPSSIYVITQEDIRRSSAQNLMQILRDQVPGLFGVANDYRNNDVFIRNTYEGSVLFLLDGTPLMDLNSFNLDFESFSIPWQQIDRIEVIKGSGGTIYGANAASGVVSIFTKDPDKQSSLYANAEYAMPGKMDASISATPVKKENFSTTIYGKFSTFSGFDQIDETENTTSTVPKTYEEGTTTITNRFTGDDNSFDYINGGYKLSFKPSGKLEINSGLNIVNTRNKVYFQEFNREDFYFINDNGSPLPRFNDQVALISNDKTRITGNVRADYSLNENHSLFLRYTVNNENRAYTLGFSGNNASHDFEIQDNITLGEFNQLSFGANYRIFKYDLKSRPASPLGFIDPEATESLTGFFAQNKTELIDGQLNLYYGVKGETFSLIDNNFYWSPMAKFTILPNDDITIWGGYTRSYTTPGYNQTNIELDVLRANSSALYPFYYPQVEQQVYENVKQNAIDGGADQTTAEGMADAYINSTEGMETIETNTNAKLEEDYPQGKINSSSVNGPKTEPTSFSTWELGLRLKPFKNASFESNFFYSNVDNSVINSPTAVATIESPTRPGQMTDAYYYGNYGKGYNAGLESVLKFKPVQQVMLELSHSYFKYNLKYKENNDFDINSLADGLSSLQGNESPTIPEHIVKSKLYYDLPSNTRLTLSSVYTTAFFVRFGTIIPYYQKEQQRFEPLWGEGGNSELIGGKFDSRFIFNFKLEKAILNEKINLYLYGYDVLSSSLVEGVNQTETIYPRQVGAMFGAGLSYNLK